MLFSNDERKIGGWNDEVEDKVRVQLIYEIANYLDHQMIKLIGNEIKCVIRNEIDSTFWNGVNDHIWNENVKCRIENRVSYIVSDRVHEVRNEIIEEAGYVL